MKKEICDSVAKAIGKVFAGGIKIVNKQYYVWVYSAKDRKMIMCVHGGNREDNPLEVILTSIDGGKTVKKQFEDETSLIKYLNEDMYKEFVVYSL